MSSGLIFPSSRTRRPSIRPTATGGKFPPLAIPSSSEATDLLRELRTEFTSSDIPRCVRGNAG